MRGSTASSLRDRTAEFLAIAERLQRQQGAAAGPSSANGATPGFGGQPQLHGQHPAKLPIQQQSEFAKKASQIGLAINKTAMKLQKLAQLAKRTSMFDDPSMEIDELTGIIKQDIQGLNASIADLQRTTGRAADENKQSADHSHTVVDTLRTRLKDATQEFKEVLTMRGENLKVHKERRQLFSSQPESSMLERTPLLSRGSQGAGESRSASSLFGGQVRQRREPMRPSDHAANGGGLMQQQQMVPQQDQYLSSRAEALQNVESTIVELGTIFTQLAEMVQAQGEVTQRIDENVEETLGNVDAAKTQLLKYLNNISSNRWLVMKVFMVLMAFLVIFVVFIA